MTPFAENLKRLRAKARITQLALAAASGVTQANISKYETGEAIPEVLSLLKLATGLGVTLEMLVEGLDVRFDAVYRDLKVSITTDVDPLSDNDRQDDDGPEPAREMRLDEIVHGAPDEPPRTYPETAADLAAARADDRADIADLHRALSELVSVAGRLSARSDSMARAVGSKVRQRDVHTRKRARPKHPKSAAEKRLKKGRSADGR